LTNLRGGTVSSGHRAPDPRVAPLPSAAAFPSDAKPQEPDTRGRAPQGLLGLPPRMRHWERVTAGGEAVDGRGSDPCCPAGRLPRRPPPRWPFALSSSVSYHPARDGTFYAPRARSLVAELLPYRKTAAVQEIADRRVLRWTEATKSCLPVPRNWRPHSSGSVP